MGQIGSTMVSVCAIGNLEPVNKEVVLLVIVIIIIIWPRENCAVPNKKLFGSMVCHMNLSKTLIAYFNELKVTMPY